MVAESGGVHILAYRLLCSGNSQLQTHTQSWEIGPAANAWAKCGDLVGFGGPGCQHACLWLQGFPMGACSVVKTGDKGQSRGHADAQSGG